MECCSLCVHMMTDLSMHARRGHTLFSTKQPEKNFFCFLSSVPTYTHIHILKGRIYTYRRSSFLLNKKPSITALTKNVCWLTDVPNDVIKTVLKSILAACMHPALSLLFGNFSISLFAATHVSGANCNFKQKKGCDGYITNIYIRYVHTLWSQNHTIRIVIKIIWLNDYEYREKKLFERYFKQCYMVYVQMKGQRNV